MLGYAILHDRKLLRRGRVGTLPFKSGLHSYKQTKNLGCYKWPVFRQLLAARKHLLYAMCTIHSADGQYRALQVRSEGGARVRCGVTEMDRCLTRRGGG